MKKKNALDVIGKIVVLVICAAILFQGTQYMISVLKYLGLRDSMDYIEECAYEYQWTNDLHDQYESAKTEIIENDDLVVQMCYKYNTRMKVNTVLIGIVMFIAAGNLFSIIAEVNLISIVAYPFYIIAYLVYKVTRKIKRFIRRFVRRLIRRLAYRR